MQIGNLSTSWTYNIVWWTPSCTSCEMVYPNILLFIRFQSYEGITVLTGAGFSTVSQGFCSDIRNFSSLWSFQRENYDKLQGFLAFQSDPCSSSEEHIATRPENWTLKCPWYSLSTFHICLDQNGHSIGSLGQKLKLKVWAYSTIWYDMIFSVVPQKQL